MEEPGRGRTSPENDDGEGFVRLQEERDSFVGVCSEGGLTSSEGRKTRRSAGHERLSVRASLPPSGG